MKPFKSQVEMKEAIEHMLRLCTEIYPDEWEKQLMHLHACFVALERKARITLDHRQ